MAIQVSSVTKIYGEQKALNNVSFNVESGQIMGFLGPNGAGKSTMMKIITCYIPATEGTVTVEGFDVNENSIEVRKKIGYLPEHNPLYLDMYVKEYLAFVADVHKLGKNSSARVKEMINITGLGLEQNKKIGALSKGYRQRVGLAQALIHDPAVLILDEPTSGLDPNQLTEIRALIREVGKAKTVMLSTHIMQEVKAVCDHIIIINRGNIVANAPVSEIASDTSTEQVVRVEFSEKVQQSLFSHLPGFINATNPDGNTWIIHSNATEDLRPHVFKLAVEKNLSILTITKEEQTLEEIFHKLTK
jgi:ABC-2 type transport system ATP-binding protein